MSLQNEKVIVISGGSRGLGRGIAEALLEKGYVIATFSRSKTEFVKTMEDTVANKFMWESIDATVSESLKEFVKK